MTSTTRSTSRWRRRRSRTAVPLLAICHGHQVLNVAPRWFIASSTSTTSSARTRRPPHFKQHHDIDPGARQPDEAAAIGHPHVRTATASIIRRSTALGNGLVVTGARRGDVIEGVEMPDRWVVGVQWHPEDDAAIDAQQQSPVRHVRCGVSNIDPTEYGVRAWTA